MSRMNGDKSRFNRVRKQRIAQRQRNRSLMKDMPSKTKPASAPSGAKSKQASQ